MIDFTLNFVVVLTWCLVILLGVARRMESAGLRYHITKLSNGLEFWYRLGIYSGTVRLIREPEVNSPCITNRALGWDCKFPCTFSNDQMCKHIKCLLPDTTKGGSHSMDLLVFNEIVNQRNDALVSFNTKIFVYDNESHSAPKS
jgi:hypothetical protein